MSSFVDKRSDRPVASFAGGAGRDRGSSGGSAGGIPFKQLSMSLIHGISLRDTCVSLCQDTITALTTGFKTALANATISGGGTGGTGGGTGGGITPSPQIPMSPTTGGGVTATTPTTPTTPTPPAPVNLDQLASAVGGRIKEGGWGGDTTNPSGWRVVPTKDKKWGNFKVVDSRGVNIADMFASIEKAAKFIESVIGTPSMPPPAIPLPSPFIPIPRAQGPFRSGQDNMEPIFDNSRILTGADFGSALGGTVNIADSGSGKGKKDVVFIFDRDKDRRGKHGKHDRDRDRDGRKGSDRPEWIEDFLDAFEKLFGDLRINLAINNNIDGNSVHKSMNKYQLKKVAIFS
jgi:hypothetical protein